MIRSIARVVFFPFVILWAILVSAGCGALESATAGLASDPDPAEVAWCEAFEVALEACPLVGVDDPDPAYLHTQWSIAKGCTDVALASAGAEGRSALAGAVMECHGFEVAPGSCAAALDACG